MTTTTNSSLVIGPDDYISNREATLLGLQHVLAMDVYVPPIILAGAMMMGSADATGLLQSTFFSRWNWYLNSNALDDENAGFPRTVICSVRGGRGDCRRYWWLSSWWDGNLNRGVINRGLSFDDLRRHGDLSKKLLIG